MKENKMLSHRQLTKWLYLLGAGILLAGMVLTFALDSLLYATGRLRPQTITLADTEYYTLVDLDWDGGETLTARSGDVQLHLQPGQRVRNLRLNAEYDGTASYERDLYWHFPGQGFSPKHRVWPSVGPDGSWDYTVPLLAGQNLRLDLADQSGAEIRIHSLELNRRPPWYTYFIPSLWQLLWLGTVPGLLSCGAALAGDLLCRVHQKKEGGSRA